MLSEREASRRANARIATQKKNLCASVPLWFKKTSADEGRRLVDLYDRFRADIDQQLTKEFTRTFHPDR